MMIDLLLLCVRLVSQLQRIQDILLHWLKILLIDVTHSLIDFC